MLYRRQFINNLLQNFLNRIRNMGCIFIDPRGGISHSIACAGGLKHFNIVVLITEYNTVLCIDMQMIEQIFQCTSMLAVGQIKSTQRLPEVTTLMSEENISFKCFSHASVPL